jgi:hypothetical protein
VCVASRAVTKFFDQPTPIAASTITSAGAEIVTPKARRLATKIFFMMSDDYNGNRASKM